MERNNRSSEWEIYMIKQTEASQSGFDPDRLHRIDDMMDRYVAEGKTAGMVTLLSRNGDITHFSAHGYMDIAAQTPMSTDTIFRIYSMTKPIVSVALMTLLEAGKFQLDDAALRWIPALRTLKVYRPGGELEPLESDITIRQLLTHTAGFTYGFEPDISPVDKMYLEKWPGFNSEKTLSELLGDLFELPLVAQPGSLWHYSIATDICGYLVELMSDMPLGDYLQQKIFNPLGMVDTAFEVPNDKLARFATLYGWTPENALAVLEEPKSSPFIPPAEMNSVPLQSGGAGLVSSASDYWHFAQMMLNGGEIDGTRILGRKTVDWMTMNHLPRDLLPLSFNGVVPEALDAYGFGLGYCVNIDPASAGTLGSLGDFGWGGLADTYCWVDPKERLVGILMQQYSPSLTHAGRRDFRNLAYQALI
jgi:CubicO group peptidase (beta-lactamase class C family)